MTRTNGDVPLPSADVLGEIEKAFQPPKATF